MFKMYFAFAKANIALKPNINYFLLSIKNCLLFFGAMKQILISMVTSVIIIAKFGAEANLMNF